MNKRVVALFATILLSISLAPRAAAQAFGGAGGGAAGANGQSRGGISFVTRRTFMAVPEQVAGGFFAASGVPLINPAAVGGAPGTGVGAPGGAAGGMGIRLMADGSIPSPSPVAPELAAAPAPVLTPQAEAMLAALARGGDAGAKWALAQAHPGVMPPAPPAAEVAPPVVEAPAPALVPAAEPQQ